MDIKKSIPLIGIIVAIAILVLVAVILFLNPNLLNPPVDTIERDEIILKRDFALLSNIDDPAEYQLTDKLAVTPITYPLTKAYVVKPIKEEDLFKIVKRFDLTTSDK